MKIIKLILFIIVLCGSALSQTENLGLAAFANDKAPIMVAVDAGLAVRQIDQPYLLFILYMAPQRQNREITVGRDDVSMIYQGQEYKMPSLPELRKNYKGQIRDIDFYGHLGKEGLISSWMRFYQFPQRADFFPLNTLNAPTVADQGSMSGFTGFATKLYFKNPGFKKGDSFLLKVKDKANPELNGEVEVVLK